MNPDELKNVWQSQASGRRLIFDEEVILRQVVRGQSDFRYALFLRDVIEIMAGLLAIVFILYGYFSVHRPWPLLLIVASVAWIVGFLLVDRMRHRRRHPHRQDSIKACAESTLAEVNHQMWLVKNVLWWYILPPIATIEIFYAFVAISIRGSITSFLCVQLFTIGVAIGCYYLNRRTVKKELEPRRREMEALLHSLKTQA